MKILEIYRKEEEKDGTFSSWLIDGEHFCFGVERLWKKNKNNVSCIPAGTYIASIITSPKHGRCYELIDVPNRGDIQIHSANWSSQLKGCLAPGKEIATFGNGIKGVTNSRETVKKLMDKMEGQEIQIIIHPFGGTV